MRRMVLAILALGLLPSFATTGYACYCLTHDVPEEFERSKVVFVGEVLSIVEPLTTDPDAPLPGRFFTIKFKVEKSWKGIPFAATEFELLSAQGRYGCFAFPPVRIGERYLVYAGWANKEEVREDVKGKDWIILTGCGTRTSLVEFKPDRRPDEINPYHDMKQLDLQIYPFFESKTPYSKGPSYKLWYSNPFVFNSGPGIY